MPKQIHSSDENSSAVMQSRRSALLLTILGELFIFVVACIWIYFAKISLDLRPISGTSQNAALIKNTRSGCYRRSGCECA